jgi:hypothetical protein
MRGIHVRKRAVVGLLFALALVSVPVLVWHLERREKPSGPFTISRVPDGVVMDFGRVFTTYKPMEFTVPLRLLGIGAEEIEDIKTACLCTVPQVRPDARELQIFYRPDPDKTAIHQRIIVNLRDPKLPARVIHLQGILVPAWFAGPPAVTLEGITPGERRDFTVTARANYELPPVGVKSVRLLPETHACSLTTEVLDNGTLNITGTVVGSLEPCQYTGSLEIRFDTSNLKGYRVGGFGELTVPVKFCHVGTIVASPEVLTLGGSKQQAVVEFRHFRGDALEIRSIDCPEFLTMEPLPGADRQCRAQVGLNGHSPPMSKVVASVIRVTFAGVDVAAQLRVVVIHPRSG